MGQKDSRTEGQTCRASYGEKPKRAITVLQSYGPLVNFSYSFTFRVCGASPELTSLRVALSHRFITFWTGWRVLINWHFIFSLFTTTLIHFFTKAPFFKKSIALFFYLIFQHCHRSLEKQYHCAAYDNHHTCQKVCSAFFYPPVYYVILRLKDDRTEGQIYWHLSFSL